ncbi:MAG: glycoside hydrolase family 5 protein [Clostridiales bacterium]|nr:glycoside hydrolase family 5 protein [Clostridiales bacterium]
MISEADFLRCEGRKIKNEKGDTVFLRGTNLGGWLLQEEWMAAFEGADSQWEIVTTLVERFGVQKARELINRFEDNFITGYDLDVLKAAGFTCLRVPFWYRNLQSDENGTWYLNENGEKDFRRLDWITEECAARGMYVILDMHGVPGHQSIAHHSCRTNHCKLYDETPEGENFRRIAAELWGDIAEHFRDNPTVAAYDLMNEPMCDYHGSDKVNEKYWKVYDLLYKAIREKDKRHIITLEAIWTPMDIPKPSVYGWKNVMYQYHLYMPSNLTFSGFVPLEKSRRFNVPVLIGEFATCRGNADWEHVLKTFNKAGYNWCSWTYKGHSKWGDSSEWFITGTSGTERIFNIKSASFEEIYERWGEPLKTPNGCVPMNDIERLGRYAREK